VSAPSLRSVRRAHYVTLSWSWRARQRDVMRLSISRRGVLIGWISRRDAGTREHLGAHAQTRRHRGQASGPCAGQSGISRARRARRGDRCRLGCGLGFGVCLRLVAVWEPRRGVYLCLALAARSRSAGSAGASPARGRPPRPRHGRRPAPPGGWKSAPRTRTAQRTELPDAHRAPRGPLETTDPHPWHRRCHRVATVWCPTGRSSWCRCGPIRGVAPRIRGWLRGFYGRMLRGSADPASEDPSDVRPRSPAPEHTIACTPCRRHSIRTDPRPSRGSEEPSCGGRPGRTMGVPNPNGPYWEQLGLGLRGA